LPAGRLVRLAWALPALALVLSCGALGLIEPTDARYAEIGREMLASGDWLTPRLNGVAHFDKPPLAYWASAAGMKLFGVNEQGARIGAALAAAFLLWAVTAIARRVSAGVADASTPHGALRTDFPLAAPDEVLLAPLVLASSVLVFALSRLLATDIFLAASVAGFYAAWLSPGARGRLCMYVALAAGFLAKGPVVLAHTVLPLAVLALALRDRRMVARLAWAPGWLLFAALSFPWYLIMVASTPGLLGWLLHNQVWQRYTTTVHHRPGPPWYFVAVLLAGALPWTWAALEGLWRSTRAAIRDYFPPEAALAVWAVLPVLFFSASGSKLPAYILPELPAFALLAARALARPGILSRWGTTLTMGALAVLIEVVGPRALARVVGAEHAATLPLPPLAHAAAAAFLAAGIAAAARLPIAAAVAALVAWYSLLGGAVKIEGPLGSPVQVARLLDKARQPQEPVIELGAFSAAIPFYLGRTVPMLHVPPTDAFDSPGARGQAFLDPASLPGLIVRQSRVWVLAPHGHAERLADSIDVHYSTIARTRTRELGIFEPMPPR